VGDFIFRDRVEVQAVHPAVLPANITTSAALLDALSTVLRFPDYFGQNWNALDECIRDLSWLPPGNVVVSHTDLPLADDRASLSIYLRILRDAVENWATRGSNLIYASPETRDATGGRESLANRKFSVTFPLSAERVVRSVLAESESQG
jgi:hypothetical protein